MLRIVKAGSVVAVAVALVACGSTTFQSTWSAPDAGQLNLDSGTKVIAMVASANMAKRRGMETALVKELGEYGLEGIAAYSVLPESVGKDAKKAKPYIEKSGAKYALVMQVTGKEQQISSTPAMGVGGYGGFYGAGWGGYGWGWGGGGANIQTDTLVGVETLLYDLTSDKLVWTGQSQTMNPSKADSFAKELVSAVGNQLHKDGLVGPAKK